MSYKLSSGYLLNKSVERLYGSSPDYRYGDFSNRDSEGRFSSTNNIKETYGDETLDKRSRMRQFSTEFVGHPGSYSVSEHDDFRHPGSQY